MQTDRRSFIKQSLTAAAGLATVALPAATSGAPFNLDRRPVITKEWGRRKKSGPLLIRFSAIGLNHGHIYGHVETIIRGGGELVSFYAKEADLIVEFSKRFPQAKLARSEKEILEDNSIHLVVSASIPVDRAPLGIQAMLHGKDFITDKPGMVTMEQLTEVKKVQRETKRIYSILYSEPLENRASIKAGDLIKEGAIGKVIQTIGIGPHRLMLKSRTAWFFDKKSYGGILCDIGSHQVEQFLFFTSSTKAEVVCAQTGNVNNARYPGLEDFGDATLRGNGGTGYLRVDYFTPDGLKSWGDGRLTILGTEGYIELRKTIDIAGREGGDHLFLVDQKGTRYFDCSKEPLPFAERFVQDILNRTQTAMSQEHCFLAAELSILAQQQAMKMGF